MKVVGSVHCLFRHAMQSGMNGAREAKQRVSSISGQQRFGICIRKMCRCDSDKGELELTLF